MTTKDIEKIWNAYQDAWADIPAEERERLLRQSCAEEVAFTNPLAEGKSLEALIQHVGEFQPQYPGAYFKTHQIISQHGQFLASWTLMNKDGSEFQGGHSYARFSEQGKVTYLAGFFTT